ncbi:MAG: DUF1569 domain-containing protein [Ferruginibacter sp.]
MDKFFDFTDRKKLNDTLQQLDENAIPAWGNMKPQQMVEHLVSVFEHSNGKKTASPKDPQEVMEKKKQYLIYSEAEIPKAIISPIPTEWEEYRFENIAEAIKALNKEIDDFENYFKKEGTTIFHPSVGQLNYQESIIFHRKHFTHHLKQFGLLA